VSDQGKHDRANTKPGDLRAETAKRVGLTVEEQNRCRREEFSLAVRLARRYSGAVADSFIEDLESTAERRWGPDWEVDG